MVSSECDKRGAGHPPHFDGKALFRSPLIAASGAVPEDWWRRFISLSSSVKIARTIRTVIRITFYGHGRLSFNFSIASEMLPLPFTKDGCLYAPIKGYKFETKAHSFL